MCPIPNGFSDRVISQYSSKIVDKKEIRVLPTVANTGIYCSSNKVGTELLGLFLTLSIVLYVEDKRPQRFGEWICLRPQVDGAR
jgi:hypothetical protein